jgi:hypothetical protein
MSKEAVQLEFPADGPVRIDHLVETLIEARASGATHVYVKILTPQPALKLKPEAAKEIADDAANGDEESFDFLVEYAGGRAEAERLVKEAKAKKAGA